MRNTFARIMTELAKERSDVCLLSGDIGNRMFDQYKEMAPDRFLNCGIAEANMMSLAAGMALSGLRPVVYTITPFTTTRCLEQIRTGVAYHEAPVVIVGTGSGFLMQNLAQHIILLRILQFSVVSQTYRCVLLATLWNSSLNYVRLLLKVNQHISELAKGEPDLLGEHKNLELEG